MRSNPLGGGSWFFQNVCPRLEVNRRCQSRPYRHAEVTAYKHAYSEFSASLKELSPRWLCPLIGSSSSVCMVCPFQSIRQTSPRSDVMPRSFWGSGPLCHIAGRLLPAIRDCRPLETAIEDRDPVAESGPLYAVRIPAATSDRLRSASFEDSAHMAARYIKLPPRRRAETAGDPLLTL